MFSPLLITKLSIPASHEDEVSRGRLLTRIEEGLACPLILVSAPAGSGKTTLVSTWAHEARVPVAWLSLDEADNDLSRFLTYMTAALQTVAPDLDKAILPLIQTPQPPPVEAVLTVLINRVAEIPKPFALVLDDYHLIDEPPVHDALCFLIEHLPQRMHLILVTRADPPLPLARLRAGRRLTELRATDLSFTPDESAALLAGVIGRDLEASQIDALMDRTEGWAAGLQLAALSMRDCSDLSGFVASFTGSHEYIVDYLIDEVLNQQPEATRRFLLETSILKQINAGLCDAVIGRGDGADMLAMLERRNLFIVPLDSERHWYRYHRLFADVLLQRLHLTSPQPVGELHRRASQWLAGHGYPVEAISHALAAGDDEMAAALVVKAAGPLLTRSETATLLHWIEQLPDEHVRNSPSLSAYHAWCLLLNGRPLEAVEARLRDVAQIEPALALPLQATIAFYQGRLVDAQNLAVQALDRLPVQQPFMRSVAQWIADIARLMSMKLSDVDERLFQMSLSQGGHSAMTIISLCQMAEIRMRQRQLHDAKALYERALSLAVDAQRKPLPIGGMALMGLGSLAYEWNDLGASEAYLREGMERVSGWSAIGAMDGHVGLFLIMCARGDLAAAQDQLQQAREVAARFDASEFDDIIINLAEARLWLAEGRQDRVARWAQEHGLAEDAIRLAAELRNLDAMYYHLRHHEMLVLVRLHIARERFDKAATLLDTLLAAMGERGWLDSRREIEVQALRALCLHAQNRQDEAFTALARALELADPDGYVRTFVDEGARMAELLQAAAAQGLYPVYTRSLLAAFAASGPTLPSREQPSGLFEPLSEREIEVLRLMADGLTNREIAERLYLAPTTVKVHARNIFGKLGARNRTEAVARARALGLLP